MKIIDEKAVEQEENNYHGTSGKEQNNLQNDNKNHPIRLETINRHVALESCPHTPLRHTIMEVSWW